MIALKLSAEDTPLDRAALTWKMRRGKAMTTGDELTERQRRQRWGNTEVRKGRGEERQR